MVLLLQVVIPSLNITVCCLFAFKTTQYIIKSINFIYLFCKSSLLKLLLLLKACYLCTLVSAILFSYTDFIKDYTLHL